jgi:soluble lytic murein transglycosylase-like protein
MQQRDLQRVAAQMAERYGLDPEIFVRQIAAESNFNPRARNERTGATGLGQVMSETAQDPGYGVTPLRDRMDPIENLRFSAEYMRAMLDKYDGDYRLALAAYNAGPGTVDQAGGIPDIEETQGYVSKILGPTPQPRPDGLMRRPEPRPEGNPFMPAAEQRNQAIREGIMRALGQV